jgi:hypothetical protein
MEVRRTSVGVLCAMTAGLPLAACGGSSSSSGPTPAAYVKSICEAIGPFEQSVQTRSKNLRLATIKNAADGKQVLQKFLNQVASDTDNALVKLKAAGTPSVKNGKQVSATIVGAFTQLKVALTKAATQAGNLPTSSPQAFQTAAQSLGSSVNTSMQGIGTPLNNLKSADLEAAAKKEPACSKLGA